MLDKHFWVNLFLNVCLWTEVSSSWTSYFPFTLYQMSVRVPASKSVSHSWRRVLVKLTWAALLLLTLIDSGHLDIGYLWCLDLFIFNLFNTSAVFRKLYLMIYKISSPVCFRNYTVQLQQRPFYRRYKMLALCFNAFAWVEIAKQQFMNAHWTTDYEQCGINKPVVSHCTTSHLLLRVEVAPRPFAGFTISKGFLFLLLLADRDANQLGRWFYFILFTLFYPSRLCSIAIPNSKLPVANY